MNANITLVEKCLLANFAAFQTKGDRRKSVASFMKRLRTTGAEEHDLDPKILAKAKAATQLKAI